MFSILSFNDIVLIQNNREQQQVDRSGVLVFQYRTFPEEVRGKHAVWRNLCPSPTNWTALCLGNLISHLLSPGLCRMLLSPRTGGLALRQPLICQSRTAGRQTEEQNSSHDAQFVSHYLPVDCVEMCFCFLLPSRGSSPTCTSCSVGCVCGNCSISAGWMFSPPRMISSFRRPSQCSSNTDCSDCLC